MSRFLFPTLVLPYRAAAVALLGLGLQLVLVPAAAALAPLLSDYTHTAWGPQQGAPTDVVQFAQTTDGWLWLASENGLFRFDGMRFERMESVQGQRLHSTNVMGLLATPDGSLWIGHRLGGISHVRDGRLRLYQPGVDMPAGAVFGIVRAPDGAIWTATSQGLGRLAPGAARFETVGAGTGLPQGTVYQVKFTRDGRQWVATAGGLFYRAPGNSSYRRAWPYLQLLAMDEAPDGTLWASDGNDKHYVVRTAPPPGMPPPRAVPGGTGMHFDRDGTMWILRRDALERRAAPYLDHAGRAAQQLGQNSAISGPLPQMWFEDREGNIWIGTSAGVDRLRRNRVHPLDAGTILDHPGIVADAGGRVLVTDYNGPVRSVDGAGIRSVAPMTVGAWHRTSDGVIWLGDRKALWRREPDGNWRRFAYPAGLAGRFPQAMQLDGAGRMWISLPPRSLFRIDGDTWRPDGGLAGLPVDRVMAFARDAAGRIWIAYVGNRIACVDGDRVRVYGAADGLRLGNVQSLLVDGARIWAGGEQGLAYFEHGRWHAVTAPLHGVSGMVRTADGDLWLHGIEGVTHIRAPDVVRLLREPGRLAAFERFDGLDGLRGSAEQLLPLPSLVQGTDGRLWFSTASTIASLDPRRIARNPLPPPVQVVAARADGRSYEGARIELPTGSSELQVTYTALALSMPERVRFRYRLQGVDAGWHDAGSRRDAFYTNLKPGEYVFQVKAANEDGVWNDTGAAMTIAIPPRFVQTNLFRALLATLAALALYGLYRLRIRHLSRRMNDLLHARLAERARIARGLHDTLLQSVQSLIIYFDQQARRLPHDAEERRKIEQTLDLADSLMNEGRDYILDLRAASRPTALGEALRDYAAVLLHDRLTVAVSGRPRDLVPTVRDELYAIAREALFNCARHANATRVQLMIDYGDDCFRILVRDDGCGQARPRSGHFGLGGMRERAAAIGASCELSSRPGTGTSVHVTIDAARAYAGAAGSGLLARLRRRIRPRAA